MNLLYRKYQSQSWTLPSFLEEESKHREIFSSHYDEGRIVVSFSIRPVFLALSKCTMDRFKELEKLSGKQFFHQCGILKIMKQGTEKNLSEVLKLHKIHFTDLSKREDLKERFPFLEVDPNYVVYYNDTNGGYISARTFVSAQKQVAHSQGCDIIEGIVEDIDGSNVDGLQNVILSNKTILARKVLFCTGAFTQYKKFNSILQLKMTPQKETAALVKVSKNEAERLRTMPCVNYYRKTDYMPIETHGAYILPPMLYPDGEYYLKIGFLGKLEDSNVESLEEVNKWYNSSGSEEVLNTMLKFLTELIPGLKVEDLKGMTCLTCNSPSGFPYIDRISPTVSVAVAGNGTGASLSDEVGRLAACMSLSGKWDSDVPKPLFEAIFESEKV